MYNIRWKCINCGYGTNKKQNYEKHISRPTACEKRLKRNGQIVNGQNVNADVNVGCQNVNADVNVGCQNVNASIEHINYCKKCNKILSSKRNLDRHVKNCNGINPLQCSICKVYFTTRQGKYQHMKNVKCELILTEEQQKIKYLEEILEQKEQQLEEEKHKRKEAEDSKSTINNYITNNTNNYFDNSINYNNYDQLSMEHITNDDIKRLFDNCKMQYPELSEDLTRMILSLKENQSIFVSCEKSNTCAVMKDGLEMRKPLIRVLMNLGMQTAMFIRNSNVIERDRKNYENNQFWADNRNACGLHISGVDEMTDSDKEIVQRNKNVVLDMCDSKV